MPQSSLRRNGWATGHPAIKLRLCARLGLFRPKTDSDKPYGPHRELLDAFEAGFVSDPRSVRHANRSLL
jgi:hypothetical protein